MQMLKNLILSLIFSLPISAYAGVWAEERISATFQWGFWSVVFASIFGGICSTFIKTPVDKELTRDPKFSKICIGLGAGLFPCISFNALFEWTPAVLTGPAFILGCLGAPILVILLNWATDPETRDKANKRLDKISTLDKEE